MFKLVLEKAEDTEIKLPTSVGLSEKQESSRKTSICFIDYTIAFDCVDHKKFGKLSSGHRTGKGQFSLQSQRKAMSKNVQTTTQLHSSHMLAK